MPLMRATSAGPVPRVAPSQASTPDPRELRAMLAASIETEIPRDAVRYVPAAPGIEGRKTIDTLAIPADVYGFPHLRLDERRVLAYMGAIAGVRVNPAHAGIEYSAPLHNWEESGASTGSALRVLADIKYDTPHGDLLHVSFSHPCHLPSWREIKLVRALFFPKDEDALQVLPRESLYVNDHPYCLHLWECPVAWDLLP